MHLYGQYCPVARAAEILADRWTVLIVRELLADVRHFNELERGLPHMSRTLLAERLRRLEQMRVLERRATSRGKPTEYRLTAAGRELQQIIDLFGEWGARWAFGPPATERTRSDHSPMVDAPAGRRGSHFPPPRGDPVRLSARTAAKLLAADSA
jgi:DNA-binding HxlR family transcriptional regulator